METQAPAVIADPQRQAELDRLGDEIAELSAHTLMPPRPGCLR